MKVCDSVVCCNFIRVQKGIIGHFINTSGREGKQKSAALKALRNRETEKVQIYKISKAIFSASLEFQGIA